MFVCFKWDNSATIALNVITNPFRYSRPTIASHEGEVQQQVTSEMTHVTRQKYNNFMLYFNANYLYHKKTISLQEYKINMQTAPKQMNKLSVTANQCYFDK